MLKIISSNRFERDLKTAIRRGWDLQPLSKIVNTLANGCPLDAKYKDHSPKGAYAGFRECHIKNDWLLVYRIEEDALELFLLRTGTHSDLF